MTNNTRYILQLRYGCQNKSCTTSTCFSCRKRLAAGAPVRRYNATSARTLAVYLSSQDNPELGLCHNPSAERPITPLTRISKPPSKHRQASRTNDCSNGQDLSSTRQSADSGVIKDKKEPSTSEISGAKVKDDKDPQGGNETKEKGVRTNQRTAANILDEPTTIDHKSFVQNVFGTVAFKMIEWLTPRSLEILARSGGECSSLGENSSQTKTTCEKVADAPLVSANQPESEDNVPDLGPWTKSEGQGVDSAEDPKKPSQRPKPIAPAPGEPKANGTADPRLALSSMNTHVSSSSMRKRSESLDPQLPKGILNLSTSPKATDKSPEIKPLSRELLPLMSQRKVSQSNVTTAPKLRVAKKVPSVSEIRPTPETDGKDARPKISKASEPSVAEIPAQKLDIQDSTQGKNLQKTPSEITTPLAKDSKLPQSLSRLSIETIDLVCNVLQSDETLEKHFLQPKIIDTHLKRRRNSNPTLRRLKRNASTHPLSSKEEWRSFIDQGIFDVLSKPESLLLSFSDEQRRLFDTQTIWYLMLRITRVVPSLAFDSLWNAAGNLFSPPERIESMYDWPREQSSDSKATTRAISNFDAAQVLNICLHALVAAAPLVWDARQLANMSRIRSYGLTTLGRENSSALEPITLCLQYDDAFTNELALRLARRLFAAIPTRRRFTELLELQLEVRSEEKREPDILETVLSTLKFLDLDTPPILNFSDNERDLHEKRVPTLILDWARTVMLQDWGASAEVPSDGPFGGALAMVAAICELIPS